MANEVERVVVGDGKYTIELTPSPHKFKALRYGEEWRDLTGDGMVLAMFHRIQELEEELKEAKDINNKLFA